MIETNTEDAMVKRAYTSPSIKTYGVVKSYAGRPGCGCGCRGTYSEGRNTGMMRLKRVMDHMEPSFYTDDPARCVLAAEDDNRYVWVYISPK